METLARLEQIVEEDGLTETLRMLAELSAERESYPSASVLAKPFSVAGGFDTRAEQFRKHVQALELAYGVALRAEFDDSSLVIISRPLERYDSDMASALINNTREF